MNTGKKIEEKHIPVLLEELTNSILIKNNPDASKKNEKNIIVDCTLGMGGHASKIIEKLSAGDIFVGFDADIKNLEQAKIRLNKVNENKGVKLIFINSNFVNLKEKLEENGIKDITGIYYDLGISSLHVDEPERGFSFKYDGPLDMRFDKTSGKTAADIVNSYNSQDLRKIFLKYSEERYSAKIAEEIVKRRKSGDGKFKTTKELSDLIGNVTNIPKTKNRIFQALRIETNKELENLEISLQDAIKLLDKEGNIFVISFHSLEDKIVKNIFKKESRDCICSDLICTCMHIKSIKKINKKIITPSNKEIEENPRSRSAKARHAKKIIRPEISPLGGIKYFLKNKQQGIQK